MGDKLLIEDLTFSLPPGGIVGVIGPNGAGKTTLFKMLTGQEKPDEWRPISYRRHGGSRPMSISPAMTLDPDSKTVWEAIADGQDIIKLGDAEVNARAYCSAPSTSRAAISKRKSRLLSGGERNRVHMARLLRDGRQRATA